MPECLINLNGCEDAGHDTCNGLIEYYGMTSNKLKFTEPCKCSCHNFASIEEWYLAHATPQVKQEISHVS